MSGAWLILGMFAGATVGTIVMGVIAGGAATTRDLDTAERHASWHLYAVALESYLDGHTTTRPQRKGYGL